MDRISSLPCFPPGKNELPDDDGSNRLDTPSISSRTGRVTRGKLRGVNGAFVPGLQFSSRAQELWALVVESFRDWQERVHEAAADVGLSPVSAWTLVQLDPEHAISQKELAARLRCNPSTVVDPTDRLEEAGLVIRRPNPADRRVNVLTVTTKGRHVRKRLLVRLFEPPETFQKLPVQDQIKLRDAMLGAVGRQQAKRVEVTTARRAG
jgi:MarR family transcriptional regulator, organic hydroperoxide resistance regulator